MRSVGLALGKALLAIVLLELGLSLWYPDPSLSPLPYRGRKEADALVWARPGLVAVGTRRQLVDTSPPADVFRVLVVGDSAAYGQSYTCFQAFAWKLQRRLEKRGEHAEVVNMGRPAL